MRRTLISLLMLCLGVAGVACDDTDEPLVDSGPPVDAKVLDGGADGGGDAAPVEAGPDLTADQGAGDGALEASAPDLGPEADGAPDVGPGADAGPDGSSASSFIKVPKGSFQMGSPTSEPCRESDEDQHQVTLTNDFELYSHEVTQAEFQARMSYNPSSNSACGGTCPVENINWHEAVAYCNALSSAASLTRCYDCTGSGSSVSCTTASAFSGGGKTIYDCPGYRLPTDAEWEYAYRAGTTTALYNGALPAGSCSGTDQNASAIAWYNKTSGGDTQAVGQKAANAWGFYDMAGNAQEWVHDVYQASLGTAAVTDPVITVSGSRGVIRGGSFAHSAEDLRAAHRKPQTMANRGTSLGLRCARTR